MELLERFKIGYSYLPRWAKVLTFFIVLLLNAYFLVTPRFVNGQIVTMTAAGGLVPYRGVELQTYADGRTLKYVTDENGYWSIPLVSRLPSALRVLIHIQDEGDWREIAIDASDIWARPWDNQFRVIIADVPFGLRVERIANSGVSPKYSWSNFMSGVIRPANAAELRLPPNIEETDNAATVAEKRRLEGEVVRIFTATTKRRISGDLARIRIGDDSGLRYVQRIQLIEAIERAQHLKIPDEHWKSFGTLRDLSEYVYRRKLLETRDPGRYRARDAYEWAQLNARLPASQRPRFR